MIHSITSFRVRYAETDSMKYVYYGNYAQYFELGRVELFRQIGLSYSEIEKKGVWLPVTEYKTRYIKPAHYDDIIYVHTYIRKKPNVRIHFDYEIYNIQGELINVGSTTLYFLDAEKQKIISCPDFLMELIDKHWKEPVSS